jgi:hypothetical protein
MSKPDLKRKIAKDVWFKDGLNFECQQCGGCCTGEPGYVWLSNTEIDLISERLEVDREEFIKKNLRKTSSGRYSLIERENGDCVLLDEKTRCCIVYDLRPIQCRTWPWWPENLKSESCWGKAMKDCPGIGKGRKHSASFIIQEREKDRKANG